MKLFHRSHRTRHRFVFETTVVIPRGIEWTDEIVDERHERQLLGQLREAVAELEASLAARMAAER